MGEHGVIFSAEEVRATLDGRKSQFRRVLTTPSEPYYVEEDGRLFAMDEYGEYFPIEQFRRCPFGQVGDRIFVKETWLQSDQAFDYGRVFYRATDKDEPGDVWRSSVHMPQWASRLTLEVTGVRVQRVQDITEEDAKAEGMTCRSDLAWDDSVGYEDPYAVAVARGHRYAFRDAWDSHHKRPWARNPWVWAVTFKVVEARR